MYIDLTRSFDKIIVVRAPLPRKSTQIQTRLLYGTLKE